MREGQFGLRPFVEWNVLDSHTSSRFGDSITGNYRGVPIRIAELQLGRRSSTTSSSGSGSSSRTTPIFDGIFADYELPEPVSALTIVVNENPMWASRAKKQGWHRLDHAPAGYEAFSAGSAHPIPAELGNLLDHLRRTFRAKHVLAAFGDSRLVILLEGAKNAFEPKLTGQVDLIAEAERIREQLGSLAQVVDHLEIDPSTEIDDTPRPIDEKALEKKAAAHVDDFEGEGCLPLMVLSTVIFIVYGAVLHEAAYLSMAFAFSIFASPMLASALLKFFEAMTGKGEVNLIGQLVKITLATVPIYFLL